MQLLVMKHHKMDNSKNTKTLDISRSFTWKEFGTYYVFAKDAMGNISKKNNLLVLIGIILILLMMKYIMIVLVGKCLLVQEY